MAELSALAGPSPSCEAVLVQMEHCAMANCVTSSMIPVNMIAFFRIGLILCKDTNPA